MPAEKRLTDRQIKNSPPGKLYDGGGLICVKGANTSKWVYRYTLYSARRDMGLGTYPQISLAQARELLAEYRTLVAQKIDPIKYRQKAALEASRVDTSFDTIAKITFEAKKPELKHDGSAGRWFSPLKVHIIPKLGNRDVQEIDQRDIFEVLKPIWHIKADSARKALGRVGHVLQHAAAMGLSVDLNVVPLAKELLGKSKHQPQKTPSLEWQKVPEFYQSLNENTPVQLALKLLILTGSRSGPVRYMTTSQIDQDTWIIPAENMKGRVGKTADFRIPLSDASLDIIDFARRFSRDGFLFPGLRKGVISDASMARVMQRRGMQERPHGFRASLETYLAETTDADYELKKSILGHAIGDQAYRSYQRSDYLEKRRELLNNWADFVTQTSKIIKLRV